jgi:DNA-binding MarR family transcriptional regulator
MKRQSTLELFILSCVDRGIATPYDLQRQAGLSLGATNPALKRLITAGLLKRTTGKSATRRPRHDYALTDEGKKAARVGWKDHLTASAAPTDIDSVLRIYAMAAAYKAPKESLIGFLKVGITQRSNMLEVLILTETQQSSGQSSSQYVRLRAELERLRCTAEIELLANLLTRLKKKPPSSLQRMLQIRPQ